MKESIENKFLINPTIKINDVIIKPKYDAGTDLRRVEHELSFSLLRKPTIEKDSKRDRAWYESRLAEITRQEDLFRERLETARELGEIDASDYFRFTAQELGDYGIFSRSRRETEETYRGQFKNK